ncbi:hypothetical protein [Mucilaginibacter auburnensis]|uniref:Myosin-like protein n=1 Tax=Mucilaginibacter auburnensis TaxID=1457233 RepID=A0A2H9VW41_9SPHI|nr:hypothetical protein [Mucilaginibacter auburnensis]PJJ85048.1 myosin-like protein [Mucilaginibacter auburnensis]
MEAAQLVSCDRVEYAYKYVFSVLKPVFNTQTGASLCELYLKYFTLKVKTNTHVMANTALLKGQRITSPGGPGEVLETMGDKVVVKLDNGATKEYLSEEITDDSSAG